MKKKESVVQGIPWVKIGSLRRPKAASITKGLSVSCVPPLLSNHLVQPHAQIFYIHFVVIIIIMHIFKIYYLCTVQLFQQFRSLIFHTFTLFNVVGLWSSPLYWLGVYVKFFIYYKKSSFIFLLKFRKAEYPTK